MEEEVQKKLVKMEAEVKTLKNYSAEIIQA